MVFTKVDQLKRNMKFHFDDNELEIVSRFSKHRLFYSSSADTGMSGLQICVPVAKMFV